MNPKLLLFDIDGTLISTHGIPKIAMGRVLKNRFNSFSYDSKFNFSGRTDWEIVEHLLGFDNQNIKITQELIHDILEEFAHELEVELKNGKHPLIYPGVKTLLEKIISFPQVHLGLVTGNIDKGAKTKLEAAELYKYFPVGGFGNDSKYRNDLAPIAIQRAEKYYRQQFIKNDIWIIGDSIYDIYCAQTNNLRCLAVSTGWTEYEELQNVNPEYLFKNLSDESAIIDILLNG